MCYWNTYSLYQNIVSPAPWIWKRFDSAIWKLWYQLSMIPRNGTSVSRGSMAKNLDFCCAVCHTRTCDCQKFDRLLFYSVENPLRFSFTQWSLFGLYKHDFQPAFRFSIWLREGNSHKSSAYLLKWSLFYGTLKNFILTLLLPQLSMLSTVLKMLFL